MDLKWSSRPTQEIATEQYLYAYLAETDSKAGLLEVLADNQDSTVRALAKVITRLVELGLVDVEELTEIISDYKHDITIKPDENDLSS